MSEGDFDYVGIAIARGGDGDTLVDVLSEREGVEVIEQPSFREVRAPERLILDFDELTEECGFEVDASLVQVVMSTYYGRMVNTDDALMLFSDPAEAAQHG